MGKMTTKSEKWPLIKNTYFWYGAFTVSALAALLTVAGISKLRKPPADVTSKSVDCLTPAAGANITRAELDCRRILQRADLSDEQRARALTELAIADLDNGSRAEAFAAFARALKLAPLDATIYDARGQAYGLDGQLDLAIADFDKAIGLAANYAAAYYNRGRVQEVLSRHEQAIADFSQAIAADPTIPDYYYQRALAYFNAEQASLALPDIDTAISLAPGKSNAYLLRAHIDSQLDDLDKAIIDASEAIQLANDDDEQSTALAFRAAVYIMQRAHYDKAVDDSRTAIKIDPKSTEGNANLCFILARLGTARDAQANCDRAIELDASVARFWRNRAYARICLADWAGAIGDINKAFEIDGKIDATGLFLRAYAHERAGDPTAALADYAGARASSGAIDTAMAEDLGIIAGTSSITPAQ